MRGSPAGGMRACLLGLAALFSPMVLFPGAAETQTFATIPHKPQDNSDSPRNDEPSTPVPGPSAYQPIPLPQIADRAEELDSLLREIASQLTPESELLEAKRKGEAQTNEIRRRARQAEDLLAGTVTPLELEDQQRYWRSRSLEYVTERKLLTARGSKLEEQIQILEAQLPEWQATWDNTHRSSGLDTVVDRIRQELEAIRATRARVHEQLNLVLIVQNQVSQQDKQISDVLLKVRQVRDQERGRLLEPDSPPIWRAREERQLNQELGSTFHSSFDHSFASAKEFLKAHKVGTFGLLCSYLLILLGVLKLRRYTADRAPLEIPPQARQVLDRPFSVALLLALLGTGEYLARTPLGIAFIFYLLYMIPVLRLLAPMLEGRLKSLLYAVTAFYALEWLYQLLQLPPPIRREIYALIVLAALLSIGTPSRMSIKLTPARSRLLPLVGIRACLLLLATSLFANILGYVSLSQILGMTSLIGPFVAAALYCGVRVLTIVLSTLLGTHWAKKVPEMRAEVIERWGGRFLALGAWFLWLRTMLHMLAVYDTVVGTVSNLLQRPIGFERINFTLGGVLVVILVLLVGYTAASVLTFCLRKFVLAKLPLQRGLPYAISTVTYYLSLLLVALAALSAAGVELNKFTVLTGALGVGLGFGLQNIVNNFVSGLILIFERPIHVGDTVEVGGLVGAVRRIGARSSTVVTYQGAEVIVPNSNLLSNQVINWTLSSQWRRVDVPVRVAYGTDPERVIKLLVGVAESHPGVLLERPPGAFFLGFGESALNFELRFWSAEQDTWFQLQSDVTVAVAKALREARIEVPFPQRDLHVRSIGAPAADNLTTNGLEASSAATARGQRVRV
jgi:potassium-dependent mechanosensitive channel